MVLWNGRRGVVSAIAAVAVLLAVTLPAAALAAPSVVRAPVAPAFAHYQQRCAADPAAALGRTVDDMLGLGLVPSPVEVAGGRGLTTNATGDLPARFDLRTQGTLPPVRQQHPYGTCWAFATMAALETALTPQSSQDLSEDNLVNYSGFGYADPYNYGGDYTNSLAYLLRGAGPVPEAADVYPTPQLTLGATTVDEVQDVMLLPGFSVAGVTDTVKAFVMQHGGVASSMTWSVDPPCLNAATAAYYYSGAKEANHAVTIVGWDDDYPREDFLAGAQPAHDGAWIVRNSWGADWGDKGYFYVSYDDTMFSEDGNNMAFLRVTAPQSGERIYGWDPMGWVTSLGYASRTAATDGWMANVFTASGRERLTAVGFYRTAAAGDFTVYAGRSLAHLHKVAAGPITVGGFFRVPIADGMRLSRGQRFVVAVHVDTSGYSFPIPIQAPLADYADPSGVPGVSFISPDGKHWTGVERVTPRSNVCLKAYTVR
jgi:C1A family cysteine protease